MTKSMKSYTLSHQMNSTRDKAPLEIKHVEKSRWWLSSEQANWEQNTTERLSLPFWSCVTWWSLCFYWKSPEDVLQRTPVLLEFSRISTTNHIKISQNIQRSPEHNGQIHFASQSRKQHRSSPSRTVWAWASNAELKATWPHHKAVITMRTPEATWPHHMPVFLNKTQGLLKNKSELFSVLHAPIYKVTSSSILKTSENLKNCQLYYAHLQIE
jgi:hypothetical protein